MKKLLAILLAACVLITLFCGCKGSPPPPPAEATEDGGVTFGDPNYYPIVNQPVTLIASIQELASLGDMTARTLWADIEEMTGIKVELRLISSDGGESSALMYASRDYPDLSFRLDGADALVSSAINAGDVLEISSEMLESFAPNWVDIFNEYPEIYPMCYHTDGKMYSLPYCSMADWDIKLRDCWLINSQWLDELGMAMPEDIDDFTAYLRAVKNAAGTGSIPTNVIPLIVRNFGVDIGSWTTLADSFGLYRGIFTEEIINNGKVEHNAQNPLLKTVINYMAQLYSEGLINTNFSGLSWADYQAAIDYNNDSTVPWYVGSYFAYNNNDHDFIAYMPMLKTNSGADPVVRAYGLSGRLIKNAFVIFKNNQYPVASLRLANYFGSVEGSMVALHGKYGVYYQKDEAGIYSSNEVENMADADKGYNAYLPSILRSDVAKQLQSRNLEDPGQRVWAYYNLYEKNIPENYNVFPTLSLNYLTDAERAEITSIKALVKTQVQNYTNSWIANKTKVDDAWDAFQKKLEDVGINRLLELEQKAYDLYIAATK